MRGQAAPPHPRDIFSSPLPPPSPGKEGAVKQHSIREPLSRQSTQSLINSDMAQQLLYINNNN